MTRTSGRRPGGTPPGGPARRGGREEEPPGTLRRLPGIGPTIDRRLREAGVTSVADLANADDAELLRRLGDVRGLSASRLRAWIAAACDVSQAAAAPEPDESSVAQEPAGMHERDRTPTPDSTPERLESFVLTLSVDGPGHVQRSTIRHTRTGIEDATPSWSPTRLATFVAGHAGLATGDPAPDATPTGWTALGTRPAGAGTRRRDRPPAGARARLELDGGHVTGGGRRTVRLAVAAPPVPWDVARYDYDLEVTARRLGDLGRQGWRPLGRARGRAATGEELVVDVSDVSLPAGVHRITLSGHIRATAPDDWTEAQASGDARIATG